MFLIRTLGLGAAATLFVTGSCSFWQGRAGRTNASNTSIQASGERPAREQRMTNPAGGRDVTDGIAATVNGRVITRGEAREAVAARRFLIARQEKNPAERRRLLQEAEREGLEDLIDRELILSEFEKKGGSMREHYVDAEVNRFIRENYNNDRKAFLKELREAGVTLRKFRETREQQLIVSYMQADTVRNTPPPTPSEVNAYYQRNVADYREEGQVRLRTITIPKSPPGDLTASESSQRALAADILRRIRAGSDFSEMARQYSADSVAKDGGDRGYIGRDTLRQDLTDVAFSLKTGEVSDILEDSRNYYILYVEDRRYGRTAPLSEVRDEVERRVQQEQQKKLVDAWLDRLRRRAVIRYY
jgi:parvulin-like peptidyl-prolyl isomerase